MDLINSQVENQRNWSWILGWKDFRCYFSKNELIQLSTLSQYLRFKLKPIVCQNLDLTEYSSDFNEVKLYSPADSNGSADSNSPAYSYITDNQNEQLFQDIVILEPYTISLALGENINLSFSLDIANAFSNLKHLTLYTMRIPLQSLTEMLDYFNCLETLKLINTQMIIWLENVFFEFELDLPRSLKCLEINICEQINPYFHDHYLRVPYDFYNNCDDIDFFEYTPQHLPLLESLSCFDTYQECGPMVNEFISKNRQLKRFECSNGFLDQESFNFLAECKQLEYLKFNTEYPFLQNVATFVFPDLTSVKTLEFEQVQIESFPFILQITPACPNVTHLVFYYQNHRLQDFNELITVFNKLESLTLGNQFDPQSILKKPLVSDHLKHITLESLKPLKIGFSKFEGCTQLRRISNVFHNGKQVGDDEKLELYYNQYEGWSSLIFEKSIQCYKV